MSVLAATYLYQVHHLLQIHGIRTSYIYVVHRLTVSLLLCHHGEEATEWLVGDTNVLATED